MSFFYCLSLLTVLMSEAFLILFEMCFFGYGCYIVSLIIFQDYKGIYYQKLGFFILDDNFIMFAKQYGAIIIYSCCWLFYLNDLEFYSVFHFFRFFVDIAILETKKGLNNLRNNKKCS